MQITLSGVRVDGRREPMLQAVDLTWSTGECLLVAGEPGHGHTALALVATGRFVPAAGTVRLNGKVVEPGTLRGVTAVVDVPGISEPDDALTLADIVAEGLALAGQRSLPRDVARWLEDHELTDERGVRVDELPGVVRTAVLAALAAENPDVRFLVLTLPDRHGGDPSGWWETARTLAGSGLGVLVQCTRSSARDLGVELPPARGATLHEPPRVVLRALPFAPALPAGIEPAPETLEIQEPAEPEDELEPSSDPGPRPEEDVDPEPRPVAGRHHPDGTDGTTDGTTDGPTDSPIDDTQEVEK